VRVLLRQANSRLFAMLAELAHGLTLARAFDAKLILAHIASDPVALATRDLEKRAIGACASRIAGS